MKRMLCLLVVLAAPAAAQTSRIEGGSTSLGGFVFHYETRLEPPIPPLGTGLNMLVLTTPPNIVHRVMLDRSQKVYFGYDARVETDATQTVESLYRVTFNPLTMTPELERMLGPDAASWKRMATPRFADPLARIRSGEAIEITLLANNTWGQKMTEYVTVQPAPRQGFNAERRREFAFATGTPRDFTAADVVLTLIEPRLTWTSPTGVERLSLGDATGGIVWVYAPNAGRFLLSLTPRGEFVRAGSVRGTSLTFRVGGNTYSINSATRIVPGDAAFNVYVLHQPNWKPTFPHANLDAIHMGAADRAEYLLGR